MHNDTLATTLGRALADADDITLPGVEAVIGELALHIRSVSGQHIGDQFLARVRSSSLRIMDAGVTPGTRTVADSSRASRSEALAALTRIADAMRGSTSPAL